MTEVSTRPHVGATKAPARQKKEKQPTALSASSPTVDSEIDALVFKVAMIINDLIIPITQSWPWGHNFVGSESLEIADARLADLTRPDREWGDDEQRPGPILNQLLAIQSALDTAEMEIRCDVTGKPGIRVALLAPVSHAADLAQRLIDTYCDLPSTLKDLRALTTLAGASPHRDQPMPPIRLVEEMSAKTQVAFNAIATQASTLSAFLWHAKETAENNQDLRGANDFLIAKCIADFIGCIADESTGASYIGGALEWADGSAA